MLLAVKAESDQPGAEDQRRNQHITDLGKPGGQPDRAGRGDHHRRGTTYRGDHRTNANCKEIAVLHGHTIPSNKPLFKTCPMPLMTRRSFTRSTSRTAMGKNGSLSSG